MSNLDTLLFAADLLEKEVKTRYQLSKEINLGKRAYPFTLQLGASNSIVGRIGSTSPSHSEDSSAAFETMYSSDASSSSSRRPSTCAGSSDCQPRKKSRYVKRDAASRLEHNQSEKCRRAQLRERLDALAALVPIDHVPQQTVASKSAASERKTTLNLLNSTVEYIKSMQTRAAALEQAKEVQRARNEQLKARLLALAATSTANTIGTIDVVEPDEHIDVVTVTETPVLLTSRPNVIVSPMFNNQLGEGSFGRFQSPTIPAELILSMCGIN